MFQEYLKIEGRRIRAQGLGKTRRIWSIMARTAAERMGIAVGDRVLGARGEVDGGQHSARPGYDAARTRFQ